MVYPACVSNDTEYYLRDKKQAARYLGVSLATLERLIRAGLPYVKVGCLVRFRAEDLADYVESRRHVRGGQAA
jgi:excisionase family DNA binding protein